MPFQGVRIEGLTELNRAFGKLSKELKGELASELKRAAEPVRVEAEQLAGSRISHIGPVWGRMKVGVRTGVVYVAPRARRRGGSPRANLAGLLMDKAMDPALEARRGEVLLAVDEMLGRLGGENGF